ncbi:DUF2339 domain-containing protein [Marininema halotolerans]|uniref:Predicted membrane protein n=1 Tax=Marininema halotolerans TaxID=1155944 RepID=A0A1I6RQZ2_9BACL|nr:DUF2339 domain-containing protein [Marininema halotolerans]SFS67092.1 Predicted membrane protein [Marininema halotolerans]
MLQAIVLFQWLILIGMGGLLIYTVVRMSHLEKRLRKIEIVQEWVPTQPEVPPSPSPLVKDDLLTHESAQPMSEGNDEAYANAEPFTPYIPAPAPLPVEPKEKNGSSFLKEGWEVFIGGRLLNRIGAFALFLGVAFFLQYAFEQNWIHEWMRIALGGGAGVFLMVLGERFRKKKFSIFSHGLTGAGVAIGYVTIYAANQFYHLFSMEFSLLLMALVTASGVISALRAQSLAISILSWLGGFLSPFLLGATGGMSVAVLLYGMLFNTGMIWLGGRGKQWSLLHLLAQVTTISFVSAFCLNSATSLLYPLLFLLYFWLIGIFGEQQRSSGLLGIVTIGSNAMVLLIMMQGLGLTFQRSWLAWLMLLVTGLYLWLVFRQKDTSSLRLEGLRVGIALVSYCWGTAWLVSNVPPGFYLDQSSSWLLIILWTLAAVALGWWANVAQKKYLRIMSLSLFWLGSFLTVINGLSTLSKSYPVLNSRMLLTIILSISMGLVAKWFRRVTNNGSINWESHGLHGSWAVFLWIMISVEIVSWFDGGESKGITLTYFLIITWFVYGVVFFTNGLLKKGPSALLWIGGGSFGLGTVTLLVVAWISPLPVTSYVPLVNLRGAAFTIFFLAIGLGVRWIKKSMDIPSFLRMYGLALPSLFGFIWVTVEISNIYGRLQIGAQDSFLINAEGLTLSGVWLVYSLGLMGIGIFRNIKILRWMSIGLSGISIIKIFLWDLSFLDTVFRILSFIFLGLILLGISFLYQKYRDRFKV